MQRSIQNYKCLKQEVFSNSNFKIVPIRYKDRLDIMKWRNEQMYHLRQNKLLTLKDQNNYFDNVVTKLFNQDEPNQILFSYLENDICIGYGGLVNISWHDKRAEMSFLLNTDLTKDIHIYESYFFTYIDLLKEITFEYLKFNKLFTETYDFREGHIRILEKKKFVLEGELKQHISLNNKYYSSLIHAILKDEKK
jgi:RimJ/RimL family protein N-acetyltransferase